MNIKITGKELKVTDSIKEYFDKKCERLQKYFGDEINVQATIKTEGKDQVAEMQMSVAGNSYRAVTESKDLYASIDKNIDIIEGQIRKTKTKKEKQNMAESIRLKQSEMMDNDLFGVEDEIMKTTFYEIRPISPEDARMKLEERPKDKFLAFINVETGKTNVIYRLKDGKNFGLVEPEA